MAAGSSTSSSNPAPRAEAVGPPITERNHEPMTLSHRRPRRTAAAAALAVGAIAALTACGGDEGRMAAAVSASTSAVIVTDASTDLGSIIIGWGEEHLDTEITTPRLDQLDARCYGSGDALAIDITAPHGWKIHARSGSQILAIENIDQGLARTDVDPPTSTSTSHSRLTGPSQTRSTSRPPPTPHRAGTHRQTRHASTCPSTSTAADLRR